MAAAVTREILITYGALAVTSIATGTGAYTLTATPPGWIIAGGWITFFNCSNAANNGTFVITSVVGNVVTVVNAASVIEATGGLAAFPVAGPSNFSHHDKYKFKSSYKTRTYTFDIVFVGGSSYANFLIHCQQAEIAYRTPRQRFRVSFSGTVFEDLNPAAASGGNTGFNQDASIDKLGDEFDTSRSRGWRVMVESQLPADLAGQSGRQDSSVRVDFDAARRRTLTISGRYTAIGANNARAQYNANIATYETVVQAYVAASDGSVYELIREDATNDDADKNLDFTRVYEEIIYDQSSGTRDNSAIKQGRYAYSRQQIAPGDSDPGTRRLEIIDIDFECWIDKNVTTDLDGFWRSTLKTYLISEVRSKFALGQVALTDHQYRTDYSQNRIFGRAQIQATSSSSSNLVQTRYTTKVESHSGKVFRGTWDGNPLSFHTYDGKATILRTRTWTKLLLGSTGGGSGSPANGASMGGSFGGGVVGGGSISFGFMNGFAIGSFGGPYNGATQTALVEAAISDGPPPGGEGQSANAGDLSGWVPISDTITTTPITIGLDGYQIDLSEVERVLVERYVEAPKGGGGGGGGTAGGTAT